MGIRNTFRKKGLLPARIAELIWRGFTVKIGVPAMVEEESILCPSSAAKKQDQWETRQLGKVKGTWLKPLNILSSVKILRTICSMVHIHLINLQIYVNG